MNTDPQHGFKSNKRVRAAVTPHHSSVMHLLEASNASEAEYMGRPIGSVNREKPFRDLLRVALLSDGGRRARLIVEKLLARAEEGDLQAIREVFDRLDGRPAQIVERGDIPLEKLTDRELFAIIRGEPREPLDEPSYAQICGPVPAK